MDASGGWTQARWRGPSRTEPRAAPPRSARAGSRARRRTAGALALGAGLALLSIGGPSRTARADDDPVAPPRGGGTIVPVPALGIAPDRGEGALYRDGEEIAFTLHIPQDGYFTVYEVTPEGHVHVIFPHAWESDPFVRAGPLSIPEPRAGWRFEIDAPRRGTAVVVAVLSPVRHAPPRWLPGARLGDTEADAPPSAVLAGRAAETEGIARRIACEGCGEVCRPPRCPWPRVLRATTWIRVSPR